MNKIKLICMSTAVCVLFFATNTDCQSMQQSILNSGLTLLSSLTSPVISQYNAYKQRHRYDGQQSEQAEPVTVEDDIRTRPGIAYQSQFNRDDLQNNYNRGVYSENERYGSENVKPISGIHYKTSQTQRPVSLTNAQIPTGYKKPDASSFYDSNDPYNGGVYSSNERHGIENRKPISGTNHKNSQSQRPVSLTNAQMPIGYQKPDVSSFYDSIQKKPAFDQSKIYFDKKEMTDNNNWSVVPHKSPVNVNEMNTNTKTNESNTNIYLQPYSLSLTKFGINLLKVISQSQNTNVAISPLSIAVVLALVQQGAKEEAQGQINRALGMSPQVSASSFNSITNTLKKRKSRNILKTATNVFVADAFQLEKLFKTTAIQNFDSAVTPGSFNNPQVAAKNINMWVSLHTNDKINELINPESLSAATQMVLANAIYFKGIWHSMFNSAATIPRPFYLANGETKTTPFMRMRRSFKSAIDNHLGVNFVILPFEGEHYSLMLLLPQSENSLLNVIDKLDDKTLVEYQKVKSKEVELEIPKFTVRSDVNLNPVLRDLGIQDIFTPERSNLYGIGIYQGVAPDISTAVHSAMLSIDEQGGSAAAASAFAVVALSYDEADISFKADRPFLAVLWDNELQIPLFIVKVENPSA